MATNVVDIEINGGSQSYERPLEQIIGWFNGYGANNDEMAFPARPRYNGPDFMLDLQRASSGKTVQILSGGQNHLTLQVSGATSDLAWTFSGAVTANGGLVANALAVTGNAGIVGNLTVNGSTVLGDSGSDTLTVNAVSTLNGATVAGNLVVTGNTTLGDSGSDTLTVNAAASFASTIGVNGNAAFSGDVTLGNAAGDAIVVNGTSTFQQPATFNDPVVFNDSATFNGTVVFGSASFTDLTVTGNASIGNGNADTHTVIGVTTFRNAAGSATQMFLDAANNRVIVGSATALGSAVDDRFTVSGGAAYFAGNSGPAIGIRYNASQTVGWTVGVDGAGANQDLLFLDDASVEILRVGDTSSTYQVRVTGDANVTDNLVVGGDLSAAGNVLFTGATVDFDNADVTMDGDLTGTGGVFLWENSGNARLEMDGTGIGFFGSTPIARPTVVGAKGGNAALADLLSELANLGLITDLTT